MNQETEWVAAVRVDHGKHFTVDTRYVKAETRLKAIEIQTAALLPNEALNGVSLTPAKEYMELNKTTR